LLAVAQARLAGARPAAREDRPGRRVLLRLKLA
jgi:hypothetical protein